MLKKTICLGLALMMMGTSVFAADFYTVNPPSAGIERRVFYGFV